MASEKAGQWVAWLLLPLTFICLFEVVARYFFNKPTIWAWDINVILNCTVITVACAYTLLAGGHVIIDILVMRLPRKNRAILDMVLFLPFLFAVGIMLWQGWGDTLESVRTGELLSTVFRPPIWPLRIVVYLAVILLLLQGFSKFLKNLRTASQKSKS